MKAIINFVRNHTVQILISLSLAISLASFVYYFSNNQLNLAYGDALSRLNISRKITDNLTPGIAQFGSIWLPLPQAIMAIFTTVKLFWHTGIAGYIMSGSSFVVSVVFLYKIGFVIFNSRWAGWLMSLVALSSVNLIYMQTTAMTEPIFIAFIILSTYFLLRWAKYGNIGSLLYGGVAVSLTTLIRYEGYIMLLLTLFLVPFIMFIKKRKIGEIEGFTLMYVTLAATGIVLWCLYSWTIFGDPLYWKDIYAGDRSIISSEEVVVRTKLPTVSNSGNFDVISGISRFWSASAQMNGIIITSLATIGFVILVLLIIVKRYFISKSEYLILFIPFSIFVFMVFTLSRNGIPLNIPDLTWLNLLDRSSNLYKEYNIRYGLNMIPFVAILVGFVGYRLWLTRFLVIVILFIQAITTIVGPYFTVYQLPIILAQTNETSSNKGNTEAAKWFKGNYTGGLVAISALRHDPEMFYLQFDYKNYIHEGTDKYWKVSMIEPQKHARWIYMFRPDYNMSSINDPVTKYLYDNQNLKDNYELAYEDDKSLIYKLKN
jgi:4-amino-4-deoxy-L-arabinose transferase-like glycosyltransferase